MATLIGFVLWDRRTAMAPVIQRTLISESYCSVLTAWLV